MRRLILLALLLLWALAAILVTSWLTQDADAQGGKPGEFWGVSYAMVEVRFPNVVTLLWTNPPDLDLEEIRLFAQMVGQTDSMALPRYFGRNEGLSENSPNVIRPGMPESLWVSLPCRTDSVGWRFWLFAVDTAGNVSQRSNIATWRQEP